MKTLPQAGQLKLTVLDVIVQYYGQTCSQKVWYKITSIKALQVSNSAVLLPNMFFFSLMKKIGKLC